MRTYNIKETYVDKDGPWSGILAMKVFVIISTENRLKVYSPGQLGFGHYIILLIKHIVYWKLIRQRKQKQIHKYNIHKISKTVDHDYKF